MKPVEGITFLVTLISLVLAIGCGGIKPEPEPKWHNDYEKYDGLVVTDENGRRLMLECKGVGNRRGFGHYEIREEIIEAIDDSTTISKFIDNYKTWY